MKAITHNLSADWMKVPMQKILILPNNCEILANSVVFVLIEARSRHRQPLEKSILKLLIKEESSKETMKNQELKH